MTITPNIIFYFYVLPLVINLIICFVETLGDDFKPISTLFGVIISCTPVMNVLFLILTIAYYNVSKHK